ncbi:MAG: homoserine kinase, partial [Bacteroidales bacterium]|nr:homoserine kinase [Bacteroidales bacterium]
MKRKSISVFAPASVANVGCGYDILGFALHEPGDKVIMHLNDTGKVTLDLIEGDDGRLPRDPAQNITSAVVKYFLEKTGIRQG